jgi:1,2-diacylglycerol 3-beta-glucosyltransferase
MIRRIVDGLQVLIFILQSVLAFLAGYLLLLTSAARRAKTRTPQIENTPDTRFVIIIPAHNEERLLGSTLDSISKIDYPASQYSVHVIADNCTDKTAEIASSKGAVVHLRQNQEKIGKGYALQWLLEWIWREKIAHDAVLFLDADSLVSPNFLQVMASRLMCGEKVIQAYYAVRQPEESWNSALRYAALAVLHYLRPQGRMVLGGSAGLKGNGMVFAADVIQRYPWSGSLTEDIEQHMALILNGERVTFAPDAVVLGEMPSTLGKMHSQHMRWERGRLETARRYVPVLLQTAQKEVRIQNRRKAFLLFDASMEHIIPPFSVMAGLTGIGILANLALSAVRVRKNRRSGINLGKINRIVGIGLVFAQVLYLMTGLRQVNAPRHVYLGLLYAPVLVIWKIKQYLQALLSRGELGWKRTSRNEE